MRRRGIWVLLLGGILYLALALPSLQRPGLSQDEAHFAVPALQLLRGGGGDALVSVELGGRSWPLAITPSEGALQSYLLLPFLALLGSSVTALRLSTIFYAVVGLPFHYAWIRALFGSGVAALTVLLLVLQPSFVAWTRMGLFAHTPLFLLSGIALWLLVRWWRGGSAGSLVLAAFVLGLGLSSKILFLWFVAGLLLLGFVRGLPHPRAVILRRLEPRGTLWAPVALAAGGALFLTGNLTSGAAPRLVSANLLTTRLYGVSNLSPGRNLLTRLEHVRVILEGSWFHRHGAPLENPVPPLALVAGLLAVGYLAARRHDPRARRLSLLLLLPVTLLLLSVFTTSNLDPNHLFLLYPFPQLVIAAAAVWLAGRHGVAASRRLLPAAAVGLIMISDLSGLARYHDALLQDGGRGTFSPTVHELAAYLEAQDVEEPVAMDWGIRAPVYVLTGGRVRPVEVFELSHQPSPALAEELRWFLLQAERRYVFHGPQETAFRGHWEVFLRLSQRMGRRPVLERELRGVDGAAFYRVYRADPDPAAMALPQSLRPVGARFDSGIELVGWLPVPAEGPESGLEVNLVWRGLEPLEEDYTVFVHLLDAAGRRIAQHDGQPQLGALPTSRWEPDQLIVDPHPLTLPDPVPPGDYTLLVGLYRLEDLQRLPVSLDGQPLDEAAVRLKVAVP